MPDVGNWRVQLRPELKLIKVVYIQGARFHLDDVISVLEDLEDTDGFLSPVKIVDQTLADILETEGLCYNNTRGEYAGTEQIPDTLEKLYLIREANLQEVDNPQLKTGYMDTTDFDNELGNTMTRVYDSVEAVKSGEPCAEKKECGIVRVQVYADRVEQWPKD